MARVYILQGFLGAGKTTFARKLAAETGAEVLCPDAYCLSCFSPEEYEKEQDNEEDILSEDESASDDESNTISGNDTDTED